MSTQVVEWTLLGGQLRRYGQLRQYGRIAHDWDAEHRPWAYASPADWESRLPEGVPVVPLAGVGSDLRARLDATLAANQGRVIVRLPAGDHQLTSFRMAGSSGDTTYAFGFWAPRLAGLVGDGADRTFVTLAAEARTYSPDGATDRTDDAHTAMAAMTKASFAPLQRSLLRLDSQSQDEPAYLGGITFRAADQLPLTGVASDLADLTVPQPAPHQGVNLYTDSTTVGGRFMVSHCRFTGAGKAWTSQPPFELACLTSRRSRVVLAQCEFDGRDYWSEHRKCGPLMANNELHHEVVDSWLHHSAVSRDATNDENADPTALSTAYVRRRVKFEQITNTRNEGRGGYTNASLAGWESCNASILIEDCIGSIDNPYTDGQRPRHLQLTSVGGRNPRGGRMLVRGGVWRNTVVPHMDGWLTFRMPAGTFWVSDGYDTTLDVRGSNGRRLEPWVYTGPNAWPTAAEVAAAGVTSHQNYIVFAN